MPEYIDVLKNIWIRDSETHQTFWEPICYDQEIQIVVWIGWSINPPSSLLWAYIISAHELLSNLISIWNKQTSLKIFIASNLSSIINNLDQNKSIEIWNITKDFLEIFSENFYPTNSPHTTIKIDSFEDAKNALDISEYISSKYGDSIFKKLGYEYQQELITRNKKYGNWEKNILSYALCHPIYEGMLSSKYNQVVKIGGRPELLYNNITLASLPLIKLEYKVPRSIQNITTHSWKSPLYYAYNGESTILDGKIDKLECIKENFWLRESDYKLINKFIGIEDYKKFVSNAVLSNNTISWK